MPGRLYLYVSFFQECSLVATQKSFSARRHPKWDAAANTSEHGNGVFLVEGPASNWIIVSDESGFILIDGGYPGDINNVLASIRRLGLAPAAAKAMLITHGHSDHTGSAAFFARTFGTPVFCSAEEVAQLTGKVKYQVTLPMVLRRAGDLKILRWMVHAITAGGMKTNDVQSVKVFDSVTLSSLPGSPVAIHLPGHTPGHTAFLLPKADAIVSGDALVTGHAISRHTGPQLLDPMFHHRADEVQESLEMLAGVSASVILPGHGAAVHGAMADIVTAARK